MRDETEITLKRAYWVGVSEGLKAGEKRKSDKLDKERLTAQVWLDALDWELGDNEKTTKLARPEVNSSEKPIALPLRVLRSF
jgi:hypothetical protein